MAYSEAIKKEAKRLYLSGFSCHEAAEKLNINPDTLFRWRNVYKWDEETTDDSIDGIKRQIAAISSSGEPISDAQVRKLDRLTRAVEKLERSSARQSHGAKGRKSRKKTVEAVSAESVSDIRSRAIDRLYEYQRKFFLDEARFRLCLKSRQIGFSFLLGMEVLMGALSRDKNQIVISASQDQSDIVRGYCVNWCEYLGVDYMEDGNALILPGGRSAFFLPCNPRTVQGYSGDLYLDEFAWHMKSRLMWQAAAPIMTQGDMRLTVTSTPYTENDMFGELVTRPEKYKRFSRHTITIHDAKAAGLNVNIGDLMELFDEFTFAQVYECKFFADELSLLSPEEVREAFDDSCLGYTGNWVHAGVDIARYRDLSAIAIAEQLHSDKEKIVALRHMDTMHRMEFSAQKTHLSELCEAWKIRRMLIDSTGIGANIAEDMQRAYPGKAQPVHFTREIKEELALGVKKLFQSHRVRIPNDRDLIVQLHAIKRKPTERGFTYDADRNEQVRHADMFWAFALAVREFAGRRRVLTSGNVRMVS
jgi:phage FluMu gp28-like protein